jgi:hypothetical protein
MDNKGDFFGDDLTFDRKIDDDFSSSVKTKTIDFLSSERSDEKTDVKEKNVDDFLNFHDDLGDESFPQTNDHLPSNPILLPTIEKEEQQPQSVAEPAIDFGSAAAVEEEYLNPYGAMKTNEKFISSEDLLTDFKDPLPVEEPPKEELPAPPKPVEQPIIKPQPVVEEKIVKPPVVEEKKSSAPPKTAETQIEAEKIFKSIGLGK